MKTRKRKAPHKITNMQAKDNTSETDVLVGQGFKYPPQVFTDPRYAAMVPHTEEEEEQPDKSKFLGRYCEFCDKYGKTYCWCNSSDWEEGSLNVENPSSNPSIEKTPSPRKSPVGWAAQRCRVVMAANENRQNTERAQARPPSPEEEYNSDSNVSR